MPSPLLIKNYTCFLSRILFIVCDYFQTSLKALPDDKILDRSNLKQSADDNFKFDENSRKLSKWIENTVGKGEIARYEQFFLFPQSFQKACFPEASKGVIVWEWVKALPHNHNF